MSFSDFLTKCAALGVVRAKRNPVTGRVRNSAGEIEIGALTTDEAESVYLNRALPGMAGGIACNFVSASQLPAGVAFSGTGSYLGAGNLAVQSSCTVTHNATGWVDGGSCLDVLTDASGYSEFRLYFAGGAGREKLDINSPDGLALEYILPDLTGCTAPTVVLNYSSDAASLFPANKSGLNFYTNGTTVSGEKEVAGLRVVRQMFDYDATTANAGIWPGNARPANAGSGADKTAPASFIQVVIAAAPNRTFKFRNLYRGGRSQPCFILGTDNAVPEQGIGGLMLSHMSANQIPGYVNQYWDFLDASATAANLFSRAHAAGFDVCGNDLTDRPLGATITDPAAMTTAIRGTLAKQEAKNWMRGRKVWIANNNNFSKLMCDTLAAEGYEANRCGVEMGRYITPEYPIDWYRLGGQSWDQLGYTEIKAQIDRAVAAGYAMFIYWHGVWSTARIDADRTANVTGTAGAPIAVNASETPGAYRARALALGTAIGNATVTYIDARSTAALTIWWEELVQALNYLVALRAAGTAALMSPSQFVAAVKR